MVRKLTVLLMAFVLAAVLASCASGGETGGFVRDSNDPADTLTETKCSMCHKTERVYSAVKSAEEWDATMKRMKANGMVVTDEEYTQILDYLTR